MLRIGGSGKQRRGLRHRRMGCGTWRSGVCRLGITRYCGLGRSQCAVGVAWGAERARWDLLGAGEWPEGGARAGRRGGHGGICLCAAVKIPQIPGIF